jgi:trans-2-enoyl-CoA reductase
MLQRIEFHRTGNPEEVAEVREVESSSLADDHVRVWMQFAPINPADINYLQGTYGIRAELPATPGMEGSGVVEEVGAGVTRVAPGDHVILYEHIGSWSQEVCAAEDNVVRIDPDLDLAQAAMLRVNPPTAWRLLTGYLQLPQGSWVAQNAANSGVGLALIQLAKALGLRTVNAVRTEAAANLCREQGADVVLVDDQDFVAHARKALCGALPLLACNAVGGDSALRLMDLLADEGTHVTYGAMSRQSLKVPNRFLIFKGINLQGLWVTKWMAGMSATERDARFADLADRMIRGELSLPVEKIYPLSEITGALKHAQQGGRSGKILLNLDRRQMMCGS